MKIEFSKEAVADLARLREFIAAHNPAAAQRYAHLLINGIHRLETQPLLGHPVEYAPEPESIRDLIVGDYLVRYAVFTNQIIILRVWHQRENWKQA